MSALLDDKGPESLPRSESESSAGRGVGDFFAFPLTAIQRRIWSADCANPGNRAYNGSFRLNLEGSVNQSILEKALNELVKRHEVLRGVCRVIDGKPMLLIRPTLKLHLGVIDLRVLIPEQRESEMDRLCSEEAMRGFDLTSGPLIRVGLIRIDDKRHVLMLTIHYIVCDGWSIGILLEELAKVYTAICEGKPFPLAELAIQFGDYAVWHHEQLASPEFAGQIAYWQRKLTNYRRFEVATDFPRPAGLSVNSAIVSQMLPRDLTDALKRFSDDNRGTMFITTLGACVLVLHRYTGAHDISVGSPVAGRTRTDIEDIVGLFLNQLVFRFQFSGDPTFAELVSVVGDTVLEAFANQEVPLEEIVKAMPPNLRHDPFYLTSFSCQREYAHASTFEVEFSGIRMSSMPSKSQGALYDLNFFIVERAAGWRLSLEYNTDLYAEVTAKEMLETFRHVIDTVAMNPHLRISDILKETGPLHERCLVPSTGTTGSAPPADADRATAGAQSQATSGGAHKFPASIAQKRFWLLSTVASGSSMLNMPACVRITGALSEKLIEKSFQFLVERHESLRTTLHEQGGDLFQIVADSHAAVLPVTDLEAVAAPEREGAMLQMVREEAEKKFDLAHDVPFRIRLFRLRPDDHVLVITIHHIACDGWSQGLLQRELWSLYRAFADGEAPNLPSLPIQYSDFTVWQNEWLNSAAAREQLHFWMQKLAAPLPVLDFPTDRPPTRLPPAKGAMEVVVLPKEVGSALKEFSRNENVTMFMLTLACFAVVLCRHSGGEDVLIGSPMAGRRAETEGLVGPFANPIALRLNALEALTLRDVVRQARDMTMDALANSDLPFMVLLEKLQPRARHGRNPLFQFYFTYQTAFIRPLEVAGLKVAPLPSLTVGTPFEIQLAIIERDNEIHLQMDYNSNLFDGSTIRQLLGKYCDLLHTLMSFPEQKIADIGIATLRPGLTALVGNDPIQDYVAPRSDHEARLVRIFELIFDQSRIGIRDDFFELGGQSLNAARLLQEIEKEFNITLDLSEIIVTPTVEKLAYRISGRLGEAESLIVPLQATGTKVPLFCIHSGGGHVIGYRDLVSCLGRDQPVFGVRAPELDGAQKFLTVEELALKYIAEIRRVQKSGPYQLSGMSFGGLVAYEVAMMLVDQGEQVALLALFDTGNPAYYKNLSLFGFLRFRSIYLVDRVRKYVRNVMRGSISNVAADIDLFFRSRIRRLIWKSGRKISQLMGRTMPKPLRSNIDMFADASRAFVPRPYAGEFLLFEAEGRTAEYGIDPTLGWGEVAKNNIRIIRIPGDHTSMMSRPNVDKLAHHLKKYLLAL
jgi:non-ribosomal peptide synthetase component F/thioesterase domain-containing protein/acyl carrier protein